jgi:cell division cycle protein 20 (cofactor of APC complex)
LAFKAKAPTPKDGDNIHKVLYSSNKLGSGSVKPCARHIPKISERTLDAPGLSGDYYLNLIDWSKNNKVAVALGNVVMLWDSVTGEIEELMKTRNENDTISSVSWTKEGTHLAVGVSDGVVELWDAERKKALRKLNGHSARVGALAWNNYMLSTGSKDSSIHQHDVRIQNHMLQSLEGHAAEVCGLKWSDDGLQLASGGNDNVVNIWDINQTSAKFSFTDHTAAVKALAWCPWQKDLLATGGGSSDRTIRFWNTQTGSCLNSIVTPSQVSSIVWSPTTKELVRRL